MRQPHGEHARWRAVFPAERLGTPNLQPEWLGNALTVLFSIVAVVMLTKIPSSHRSSERGPARVLVGTVDTRLDHLLPIPEKLRLSRIG